MKIKAVWSAAFFLLLPLCLSSQVKLGPWVPEVSGTSFTVNWETPDSQLIRVEVIKEGTADTLNFYQTRYGRSLVGNNHSVKVTGLEAGTGYAYRVCGIKVIDESQPYQLVYAKEENKSEWYHITTLDNRSPLCRFSMVTDIHGNKELYSDLFSGVAASDMDFMLLIGDMVSYMTSIDVVKDCIISPVGTLLHDVPMLYARGNHEGRGQDFWRFEEVSPSRDGKAYYAFRQGPVAFVVLDCGEDKPDSHPAYCGNAHFDQYRAEEAVWLENVVKEKWFRTAPFKICISHIPLYVTEDSWYTQKRLHEDMTPILNKAGIDLVLSGHFHRHVYTEAGHSGNRFPVLVHNCDERLDFVCDGKKASIKTYDREGRLVHEYEF